MTDADRLSSLVAVWWEAVDSFTRLLEHVGDDQWATPTDLPGWDVRTVAAHTAHLEALLAGRDHEDVEIGDVPHARGMMGQFTEQGVVARRPESPDALITEIRESTTARHTQLLADPPTDLPGWDVRAVAAHTAHLESLLAGRRHDAVDIGHAPHARGTMGTFTEEGVVARR